jgi:hypothetical protein
MAVDQNRGETSEEPVEDSLSALKRLAVFSNAGAGPSRQSVPSQADDLVETIPDWLELLLAKYGEEASSLVGAEPPPPQFDALAEPPPVGEEASKVASLLEQMASESEMVPPAERLATSVDWGKPAVEEEVEEESAPPVGEEAPDWLSEIGKPGPEVEVEDAEYLKEAEPPADEEDVPDWLQELTPRPQPPITEQPPEGDVPEWLSRLGSVAPDEEPSEGEVTPPTPEGEVPDWLAELDTAAPATEPPEGTTTPPAPTPSVGEEEAVEGDVPDWLARLADAPTPPTGEPPKIAEYPQAEEPYPEVEGPTPTEETQILEGEAAEAEPPAWLAELGVSELEPPGVAEPPQKEEETAEGPPPDAREIPEWLREVGADAAFPPEREPPMAPPPSPPSEPPPSEVAMEMPSAPEAEIPDWLHGLENGEPSPPPELPSELLPVEAAAEAEVPAEPEADIPDWLASLQAIEGEEYIEPQPAEAAAEVPAVESEHPQAESPEGDEVAEEPDWLAALRASRQADVLELGQEVVEAEEETLPDWLTALRKSQAAAETPPAGVEALEESPEGEGPGATVSPAEYPMGEAETEVPEWLAGREGEAVEEAGALDWLAELEAIEMAEEGPPSPGREKESETPASEIGVQSLPEEETVPEYPEGEEVSPAVEGVAPGELPDWLRELEPKEGEPAEVPQEKPVETEGVLAGLPRLLPVTEEEPEGEEELLSGLRARAAVPEVPDVEGAQLFSEIAAEPPPDLRAGEAVPGLEPRPRRNRIVGTLLWTLIFIILVVAIAATLLAVLDRMGELLGGPAFREFFGSPLVIDPAPVNTFRAQVTKLPPEAVVVVSFDYGPATGAEMDPLAAIIVRDLLDNRARVVAVSLRPEGAAMAQRLLDRLKSEYPDGQRTLNLGYLPGQTAGVRSLAFLSVAPLFQGNGQTMGDYPSWQDVGGLGDVALIVDVADNPLSVRWWVEQVGPGTPANRPMVAAVSAAADPTVRPYYNPIDPKAGQLGGLVSGVTGAAAYENRLGQPGRAMESLAAQSVAHLGLVVLGVGGTLMGFQARSRE